MLGNTKQIVSPSRTYVAVCNKGNFDGHYFRKFTVPENVEDVPQFAQDYAACHDLKNNAEYASWYFLNVLDSVACIDGCVTWEDFQNIKSVEEVQAERDKRLAEVLKL